MKFHTVDEDVINEYASMRVKHAARLRGEPKDVEEETKWVEEEQEAFANYDERAMINLRKARNQIKADDIYKILKSSHTTFYDYEDIMRRVDELVKASSIAK